MSIDADWNTRFPFGTSFALHAGRQPGRRDVPNLTPGFLLDVNAPLGEPNRLYLWLGRWHAILGLPEFRSFHQVGIEVHCRHCTQEIKQDNDGWWLLAGKAPDAECDDYHCEASDDRAHRPGVRAILGEYYTSWRPHIAGCDRYRYHREADGHWSRNPQPEPLHWGWLTITRRARDCKIPA